ncbi:MAG: TIGR01777 family protein [Euryarchaeota archaeon]|nr:TIGR01777 family protein [Euryarchaeota archaeon]
MPKFVYQAEHDATKEEIWNWYNSPGAFRRIMPEWEGIIPMNAGALENDDETIFKVGIGPIRQTWVAKHHSVIPGETFADRMMRGPFGAWNHVHRFDSTGAGKTTIYDDVEYKLPLHFLTGWSAGLTVLPRMRQMFKYRSTRVDSDIKQIQATANQPRQKVLVSGSTGMIGLQLCAFLETAGHDVYRLLRPKTKLPADVNSEKVIRWNDLTGDVLEGDMNGFDSVIHLAGAGIGDKRWSKKRKQLIRDSRVIPTENLSRVLASLDKPPKTLLSGSAIGFYGDRGSEVLDEKSKSGSDFLAEICSEWEEASSQAKDAGIRVVNLRTGIVVSPLGGALSKLLLPAKMGGGGPVGGGKQIQSWISLDDEIFAIHHLMMTESCTGPYNLTSPNPVPQKKFAKILGRVIRRPAFMPLPGFMIRIMFGEMGKKLVLEGQHVEPSRLLESGFEFTYNDLESCLRNCLGRYKNTS